MNRSPEELFSLLVFALWPRFVKLTGGICPQCAGALDHDIQVCDDHEPGTGAPCPNCEYYDSIRIDWVCSICKHHSATSASGVILHHPAVLAFNYEHGIALGYPYSAKDFETVKENEQIKRQTSTDHRVRSRDPLEIEVTYEYNEEAISLVLDEELNVLEVAERGSSSGEQ